VTHGRKPKPYGGEYEQHSWSDGAPYPESETINIGIQKNPKHACGAIVEYDGHRFRVTESQLPIPERKYKLLSVDPDWNPGLTLINVSESDITA
jgi:hypothetical protein